MSNKSTKFSPTTAAAIEVIRHTNASEILPELLVKKLNLERWQAVATLKELSESGYGNFVMGRRGGQTRLEKAEPFPDPIDEKKTVDVMPTQPATDDCQIFLLRRSPSIHVKVPADINREEADKLGKWLALIAIDAL